jgi:hypothetical protein
VLGISPSRTYLHIRPGIVRLSDVPPVDILAPRPRARFRSFHRLLLSLRPFVAGILTLVVSSDIMIDPRVTNSTVIS